MGYRIEVDESGKQFIKIENEPAFHHVLIEAHLRDEIALRTGAWMVVLFFPDTVRSEMQAEAVQKAANLLRGQVNLGMHLFQTSEEMAAWHPGLQENYNDPITVFLLDGMVLWSASGIFSKNCVHSFAVKYIRTIEWETEYEMKHFDNRFNDWLRKRLSIEVKITPEQALTIASRACREAGRSWVGTIRISFRLTHYEIATHSNWLTPNTTVKVNISNGQTQVSGLGYERKSQH